MFFILLIHVRAPPRVGGSGFCNPFVGFTVDRQHFWQGGKVGLFHCGKFYTALWHCKTCNSWISAWSDQSFALKGWLFEFPADNLMVKQILTGEKKNKEKYKILKWQVKPFFPLNKVFPICTVKSAPLPSEELRKKLLKEKLMFNSLVQTPHNYLCYPTPWEPLLLNPQYFGPEATKFCFAAILQDTPRSSAPRWVSLTSLSTQTPAGVK